MKRQNNFEKKFQNKIIHIDMDCFFAAVEIRDNPELKNKPVAVGNSESRGVITTCNYIARKFGIKSAMSSVKAKQLCPKLIFMPVQIEKYRNISDDILNIYKCYTKTLNTSNKLEVEPLEIRNKRHPIVVDTQNLHSNFKYRSFL